MLTHISDELDELWALQEASGLRRAVSMAREGAVYDIERH